MGLDDYLVIWLDIGGQELRVVVRAFGTEEDGISSLEESINNSDHIGATNNYRDSGGLDVLGTCLSVLGVGLDNRAMDINDE